MPKPCDLSGPRVGYVVKRYPRFSETFIVNEILAHEEAGTNIDIFALRPPADTHFQNSISKVRAPVTYLPHAPVKSSELWCLLKATSRELPRTWQSLRLLERATVVDIYQAMNLALLLRRRRITHLHAHFASSAATVAMLAAHTAGIGFSITMHAKDIFHESVDAGDLAAKIEAARLVVTVSEFNREYLANRYGHADKIYRVYNGLDLKEFPYCWQEKRQTHIVAVGRLVPKKGFSILIDACAQLAKRNLAFQCDIVGSGELEGELTARINQRGLGSSIRLTGNRPQNEVKELIGRATLTAAPCVVGDDGNRDGLPTVITESLALGTPCVATDVTGIPEIIHHGRTGMLVPQEDPDGLAEVINQLAGDREFRSRLSRAGRQLVEQDFEIHRNAASIRRHFTGLERADGAEIDGRLQEVG